VILLDPAAAYAGELPSRPDVSYFDNHPCHTSVFEHFRTDAEINDILGGTHSRQAIVCALMQGRNPTTPGGKPWRASSTAR
jgi:hypothetical protein